MLRLYTLFHLNLMYSAIEEEARAEVVACCYWPLLRLAESVPVAIELSGYTLEEIQRLDPAWVNRFRELLREGTVELVGSGYSQIIGPLVPARVNHWNQKLGCQIYERHLGVRPDVALVNEMAYSAGLLEHYLNHGYRAIVMEWNNARTDHPEWSPNWRYFPQRVQALDGRTLDLIWLDCIAFQKLQRYAHSEDTLDEYLAYLRTHLQAGTGYFPLYGNDAEVFGYRPGRYATETPLTADEWDRLETLFRRLRTEPDLALVPMATVLASRDHPDAGHRLALESPQQPVLVKKQPKYNITRWAVTGRDDLEINTACYQAYDELLAQRCDDPEAWKTLCWLWSSDFRTHLTPRRWRRYQTRLRDFLRQWARAGRGKGASNRAPTIQGHRSRFFVQESDKFLAVIAGNHEIVFNRHRGLAVHRYCHEALADSPLFGTLPHGYYEDIELGADFYSGHVVIEIPGQRRVTDLVPVVPEITDPNNTLCLQTTTNLGVGTEIKTWTIEPDRARLRLSVQLHLSEAFYGTIRLGFITLMPESFEAKSLFYQTHNGGHAPETHVLNGRPAEHGRAVSALISAHGGFGATEGLVSLGDHRRRLTVRVPRNVCAGLPMLQYQPAGGRFFCRLFFSLLELDETRQPGDRSRTYRFQQEIACTEHGPKTRSWPWIASAGSASRAIIEQP